MRRRQRGGAVLGMVVALAACGGGGDDASPPTTASTTAPPGEEVVFDWAERPTLELPGGWTVSACEGDAPLACVTQDGEQVGVVEQIGFPLDTLPDLEDALEEGLSPQEALERSAIDELESLEADRKAGCEPEYDVRPVGPEPATVAGRPGLRYGFEGVDGTGAVVERISKHALLTDEGLFLVVANALEPEGCLAPEGEFRVATLEQFEPELARVAAGSRLRPLA